MVVLRGFALLSRPPTLSQPLSEGKGVEWFDDYYTVQFIDDRTIAIGEPRYWQQNYNYLILGESRAILFDSGPGVRNILPVVKRLTSLPVTVVASHLHFDHVGNHEQFDRMAMVDLPELHSRIDAGVLRPDSGQHVGFLAGLEPPALRVTEWWEPGARIDLGGRTLEVIHAPGHTPESIVLFDSDRRQAFTGDHIYPGELVAFLPGSNLGDYLATTERLMQRLPEDAVLLTAHRINPPGAPLLHYRDLADLAALLEAIKAGTGSGRGVFPHTYTVNDRMTLLTDLPWLERWD
jgi:glyoxylase-like metal-dependent hydrolase (beta-lactamase superfamily II)